jgi:hypothetical protein
VILFDIPLATGAATAKAEEVRRRAAVHFILKSKIEEIGKKYIR